YHHPANLFAARFIGSPAMNLLDSKVLALSEHGIEFEVQGQRCTAAADPAGLAVGEPVVIGIRPEHVACGEGPLRADVTHVEALGEHSVVYAKLPGIDAPLLAKTNDERVQVGSAIRLGLPSHALHVFGRDGVAQRRLRQR
ncbi:MAG TPA: TOBE domain-containing protein, partial [Albitalea sp.]|nr:TOBE domain-containing protein [Albitalea sp.]